jgi:ABC-type transport system involved in multi-copper enzyme maturation permease subunit
MNSSFLSATLIGTIGWLIQFAAALPWLAVLDPRAFRHNLRKPASWIIGLMAAVILGGGLALFVSVVGDAERLLLWGRAFGALLNAQLMLDFFVLLFPLLMLLWPQGAAVALAAFREGIRQPMFWLIMAFALGAMLFSPFLPYFTFGEDFKMVQELGYDIAMLAAVLFAVLAASLSITEEIEGRTAITVMSKPVSRRQFLLGKYVGILLAAVFMTAILGWVFTGVMWFELWWDQQGTGDPGWLVSARLVVADKMPETTGYFTLGAGVWFDKVWEKVPGLLFGLCQVMVLLAIAVALATRLPFIVTFVSCIVVFFLGHLTHILVRVSAGGNTLINFTAKFFDNVLPGLEYFDLGQIVGRDVPPDPKLFGIYVGSVLFYAILYSIIALLFGLILFEDRDLA